VCRLCPSCVGDFADSSQKGVCSSSAQTAGKCAWDTIDMTEIKASAATLYMPLSSSLVLVMVAMVVGSILL